MRSLKMLAGGFLWLAASCFAADKSNRATYEIIEIIEIRMQKLDSDTATTTNANPADDSAKTQSAAPLKETNECDVIDGNVAGENRSTQKTADETTNCQVTKLLGEKKSTPNTEPRKVEIITENPRTENFAENQIITEKANPETVASPATHAALSESAENNSEGARADLGTFAVPKTAENSQAADGAITNAKKSTAIAAAIAAPTESIVNNVSLADDKSTRDIADSIAVENVKSNGEISAVSLGNKPSPAAESSRELNDSSIGIIQSPSLIDTQVKTENKNFTTAPATTTDSNHTAPIAAASNSANTNDLAETDKLELKVTLIDSQTLDYSTPKFAASDRDLDAIKKRGALVIGMTRTNREPFFSDRDSKNLSGCDYDWAMALARALAVPLTLDRSFTSETELLRAVADGKIDAAISGLLIPQTDPDLPIQFSSPYLGSYPVVAANLSALKEKFPPTEFLTAADLNRAEISLLYTDYSGVEKIAVEFFPQATRYGNPPSTKSLWERVVDNAGFVLITDNFAVRETQIQHADWWQKNGDKIVILPLRAKTKYYGVAIAESAPRLLNLLNSLDMKIGDLPLAYRPLQWSKK